MAPDQQLRSIPGIPEKITKYSVSILIISKDCHEQKKTTRVSR
jgi:hypothetical protein